MWYLKQKPLIEPYWNVNKKIKDAIELDEDPLIEPYWNVN